MAGRQPRLDPAADDMVVDGEARGSDRLQHRIAQALAVIDLLRVGGLEQQAAHVDDLHQQAVASLQRMVVDMPRIRQVAAGRLLAIGGATVAGQGR